MASRLHITKPKAQIVGKSPHEPARDYKDRISDLEKRLEAAVEEHRRMRRELEALEDRDPYHVFTTRRPFPHIDDEARN
jgi:predicted  nucleic acid-binding Zn-ribbon protein